MYVVATSSISKNVVLGGFFLSQLFLPENLPSLILPLMPSPYFCSCLLVRLCYRLSRIKYKEEARKLLFKYAEAAKKMIDSR